MKTQLFRFIVAAAILFGAWLSAPAQVYVKLRPPAPVVVRPPQPSHVHVWIEHDWQPAGKEYRYTGGHWELAPGPGVVYHKGYWKHHPKKGYVWVNGGWKKKK